jgi:hypothetical protein
MSIRADNLYHHIDDREWIPNACIAFSVEAAEWQQLHSDMKATKASTRIVRKDLEDPSYGQIKLIFRSPRQSKNSNLFADGCILLMVWSPPHTLRGIPLHSMQLFFDRVVEDSRVWYRKSGDSKEVARPNDRNMYDANQYVIKEEATKFDASYAEIATDYGPPIVFISHVWGETAETTKTSLNKLRDARREQQDARGKKLTQIYMTQKQSDSCNSGTESRDSTSRLDRGNSRLVLSNTTLDFDEPLRVWFCALCNNQARIDEELGTDVMHSPFAQVLNSPTVTLVVLISPLKALERKWCTFEFTVAVNLGKDVMMATREGIVEAGQVAPRFLKKLSERLLDFDAKSAGCNNPKDAAMIDEAVIGMGGYDMIDDRLRTIFQNAIEEAERWTDEAMDLLKSASRVGSQWTLGGSKETIDLDEDENANEDVFHDNMSSDGYSLDGDSNDAKANTPPPSLPQSERHVTVKFDDDGAIGEAGLFLRQETPTLPRCKVLL